MKYWRIVYDIRTDTFRLETSSDGGNNWEVDIEQRCVSGELVSYKFLTRITEYKVLGYEQKY